MIDVIVTKTEFGYVARAQTSDTKFYVGNGPSDQLAARRVLDHLRSAIAIGSIEDQAVTVQYPTTSINVGLISMTAPPPPLLTNREFHSQTPGRSAPASAICPTCGSLFNIRPELPNQRYCSPRCRARHKNSEATHA